MEEHLLLPNQRKRQKIYELIPPQIVEALQEYVQGITLYVPCKTDGRCGWGEKNGTRTEYLNRNIDIFKGWLSGSSVLSLAEENCLTEKSIRRILREIREMEKTE